MDFLDKAKCVYYLKLYEIIYLISVISGWNNTKIGEDIPVGDNPTDIVSNEDTNTVYVANSVSNGVSVIDSVSNKVVAGNYISGYPL